MPRVKEYIDSDVLIEAKARIRHIFDTHDTVVVNFSGGKDSLAVLHLVKETALEYGISKIPVVFRDEELIPAVVIDFVNEYRLKDWIDMYYYAIPLASSKYILGKTYDYVQWDKNRKHIRPIPQHAITTDIDQVFDQYTTDEFIARNFNGKVAFLTGIRASESLIRYQSSVTKLNDNYINKSSSLNVSLCKPIYDWQEDDVFKYFYENGIKYCELYDVQMWANMGLRVSTPLHAESAKRFHKLREIDPILYEQIIDIFPEMLLQERYFREFDREKIYKGYPDTLEGIEEYINLSLEGHQKALALKRIKGIRVALRSNPNSYPVKDVFKYIVNGHYKRNMMPVKQK